MFKKTIKNNSIYFLIFILSVLSCTEKKESLPKYIDEIILDFKHRCPNKNIGVLMIPGRQINNEFELYCYAFDPKTTKLSGSDEFIDSSLNVILFYRHIDIFHSNDEIDSVTNNKSKSIQCDILPIIGYYYNINNKLKITNRREIELKLGAEKYFYPFIEFK